MRATPTASRFSLNDIHRAEAAAKRVERALAKPSDIDHSLRSLIVLATTLQTALARFRVDWIDEPSDQLVALRKLSSNLAASAGEARDQLTIALGVALDYRLENGSNEGHGNAGIEALAQEITGALQSMTGDVVDPNAIDERESQLEGLQVASDKVHILESQVASGAAAHAADKPVVANRRTGIYHSATSPVVKRIADLNRIAFASAEAAIVEGFRASRLLSATADNG